MSLTTIISLLLIGAAAGLLSGLMGVGGGIIVIPALVFFMGVSQHEAQGMSLALLSLPVALGGAFNYYKSGHIEIKYVLFIAAAFIIGGYIGSLYAVKAPENLLKKVFAVLMILVATKMLFEK